jgi:hypothetical protein
MVQAALSHILIIRIKLTNNRVIDARAAQLLVNYLIGEAKCWSTMIQNYNVKFNVSIWIRALFPKWI